MDSSRRLERMRNREHHFLYIAITIGVGYLIALMAYGLFLYMYN